MRQTNMDRANRGLRALERGDYFEGWDTAGEAVTDLLTDLRHLAEQQGLDWDRCERLALDHYMAERENESSWVADLERARAALDGWERGEGEKA